MPEVTFHIRWPDGATQACYSPSRAIEDTLMAGAQYPVEEFLRRATEALDEASERVRAKFGFACTSAMGQRDQLRAEAPRHGEGMVAVLAMEIPTEPRAAAPPREPLAGHVPVVVIGGGQAGLAASHHLARLGVEHVVLERHRIADSWRHERWEAFCLVTPNWQCTLPGFPYDGPDPDGFMLRDEIVDYVQRFARHTGAPVIEGVEVTKVRPDGEGYVVETACGTVTCEQVILAVGAYHDPIVPGFASAIPGEVTQLHSVAYSRPSSLPDGAILVVGSGQSGAQIAEDLHLAGRRVHLAVGDAPRISRRYRGRDVVAWMHDIGHYDVPIERHPMGEAARHETNHYVTGRDGGRDIDLREFAREGMVLHGRLDACEDGVLRFDGNVGARLDHADAVAERAKDTIDRWIAEQQIDAPDEPRYVPGWHPADDGPSAIDLGEGDVRTIIWATGFRSNWSWVDVPDAFDEHDDPIHTRGVTTAPGLSVLGLPWLHTWGSGRFAGIDRDARYVAEHVASTLLTTSATADQGRSY